MARRLHGASSMADQVRPARAEGSSIDHIESSGIRFRPGHGLRPGTMVTSNVRLVRPIAVGGMGSVWIAEHRGLHAHVAVKFMDPALASEHADVRERFKREAAISARIRSVHAVQVFDHGELPDGTPYIVMELLDGHTLDEWLELHGALSLRETALIVAQLAKVLHRAHVLGIVHRDVKPENVFLIDGDYELFVKLVDFGIAKQTYRPDRGSEVTKTGTGVGTPGYISPEQAINAKRVDHRADLWALGALAYRMLTGKLPFGDENGSEPWWLRLSRGEFAPVTALVPELPAELDAWFRRALDGRPERRFSSAQEMAQALGALARRAPECDATAPEQRDAVKPADEPPPSTKPGQYDLFAFVDDETENGTSIMDPRDRAEPALRRPEAPPVPEPVRRPHRYASLAVVTAVLLLCVALALALLHESSRSGLQLRDWKNDCSAV